ncbi:dTDP-glucose 4,6-dehydratase [Paraburkholderia acidicola]|uniref:dTDP-glucose 4,6-dehydratase n=1 Tax=Paraburkholderia acidicola TaxID=1912599 RepID=A0A2A4F1X0_9BURK|nr:NAD(P)-dependent oxidoreductase [Paraburkholderia acidicola]PCE26967.1 dTDP-glucose 4,6-dehydratase [Paraburkholderia acidicola]
MTTTTTSKSGERIFLAGATGVIGRALVPLLTRVGYTVYGSTRRAERSAVLDALGAIPVVVDVFDAAALRAAVQRVAPTVVIHQLTDLPAGLDPKQMADAAVRNARIRSEGTRNLVDAALAAGCARMVAQSIAWAYAPGPQPYTEAQPLDLEAQGARSVSVVGVAALERCVLDTPGLHGAVLRYGQLYGPGTGAASATGASPVHVEAAAWAALLAVQHAAHGAFNVTEDNDVVSNARVRRELGWEPGLRLSTEAM